MNFTLVIKNSSDKFHLVDFRSFLLVYETLDLDLKISFFISNTELKIILSHLHNIALIVRCTGTGVKKRKQRPVTHTLNILVSLRCRQKSWTYWAIWSVF